MSAPAELERIRRVADKLEELVALLRSVHAENLARLLLDATDQAAAALENLALRTSEMLDQATTVALKSREPKGGSNVS